MIAIPYKAGVSLWEDIKYIIWLHKVGVDFEIINKGHPENTLSKL